MRNPCRIPRKELPRSFGGSLIGVTLGSLSSLALTLFALDHGQHTAVRVATVSLVAMGIVGTAGSFIRWRSKGPRTIIAASLALVAVFAPLRVYAEARYGRSSPESVGPNVLFITADTLRADDTSVYGGPVPTPNLERLAAQGTLFERHYSIVRDPGETLDIASENRQVTDKLVRQLDEWSQTFPVTLDLISIESLELQPIEDSDEALRGMGYLN